MTKWALTVTGAIVSESDPSSPPSPFAVPLSDWAASVETDVTPSFIIPGVLPTDNLVLLSGLPKESFKTWFAMLTALVACTGKSTSGLECHTRTAVLYIYQEGARRATLARFRALCDGNNLGSLESVEGFFFKHRSNFLLESKEEVRNLCEFIKARSIGLVYIDTLAKSISGDENNAKEMGITIRATSQIREAGATVVLVHHLKKGRPSLTAGTSGYPNPDDDIRGSGALAGAYETHWAIRGYPARNPRERTQSLIIGGKEADYRHYTYAWEIENAWDEERKMDYPTHARLAMLQSDKMPFFEQARESRTSRGNDGHQDFSL
jgi:hypothetical protein